MSDNEKDLFSKMDALREKRAAGALIEKPANFDDFPLLTEVITRHAEARTEVPPPHEEIPPPEPEHALPATPPAPDPARLAALAQALETRLAEHIDLWLDQQRTELNACLRQIIQTEIRQALGDSAPKNKNPFQ